MFTIRVETHFRASHRLTLSDGSKERSHRHNWTVVAEVRSDRLSSIGLVMDFRRLKATVDSITAEFDNTPLDEIDYFRQNNSSAECVAKYIYEKLEPKLPENVYLEAVRVVEKRGCWAKFAK